MIDSLKLHTFARRYCIDRIDYWHERYLPVDELASSNMGEHGYQYTDEAYDIFPRYNVLEAILLAVETLDSDNLPELGVLVELLSGFGHDAKTEFTSNHDNQTAQLAEQSERHAFVDVVKKAVASGLNTQAPLPYRRVLTDAEVSHVRSRILSVWGATEDYWYPLSSKTHSTLLAFDLASIDETRFRKNLEEFLSHQGDDRIFELREHGQKNYLMDAGSAVPEYDGTEGYWCSPSDNWIVYCSHENTITLGGTVTEIASNKFEALKV